MSAARPFITFASLLRAHGFAVAPDQTTSFLAAITLLGPRSFGDILRAAHATLAPSPERHAEFDALFRYHFLGLLGSAVAMQAGPEDETVRISDGAPGRPETIPLDAINEAGHAAAGAELLTVRRLEAHDETTTLRRFSRLAPAQLPVRAARRTVASNRGPAFDLRRTLRDAVRTDGDMVLLPRRRRKLRQRNILLLVDISGSMKARTDAHLRFAHALTAAAERIEVFTFGTRLTRITQALRLRDRGQALTAAAEIVPDWDGGTRIGQALLAFLAVPRFAGYARGALVLVISDGLERGEADDAVAAVHRLSQLAWRLDWLSPLAGGAEFKVQTELLRSITPIIDALADGGSTAALCDHVLAVAARARA